MDQRIELPDSVPPEALWAVDGLRAADELPEVPGLAANEVQQLRERLSRHDDRVTAALHEVELPGGLAARLLESVRSELAVQPQQLDVACPSVANGGRRLSRRAVLVGVGLALAAALLVAVGVFSPSRPQYTPAELMESTIGRYNAERSSPPANQELETSPREFPLSEDVAFHEARWRWFDEALLGGRGVAYDLSIGNGAFRGALYVMEGSVEGLITSAPPAPTYPPTQGACAAAWQSGGLVYVLVVEGGGGEYQRFLRRPGGAIASLTPEGRLGLLADSIAVGG
jgi:hypothetical protein